MNLTPIEKWVGDCALGILHDDDCNPQVGMGKFQRTAVSEAMEAGREAAMLFGGGDDFFLLQCSKDKVAAYVKEKRGDR
jgi:hypothetical protein